MRFLLPLLAFLGLALVLGLGLQRDPRLLPSALIDQPAPALRLPLLAAPQQVFDSESLKGQAWMLNVWASWCEPCRREMPALQVLARQDGVTLIGLNYRDSEAAALGLLRAVGNPYRASVVDADGRVGLDFGLQGVPETFVIDAAGRVRLRHQGPVTAAVWREQLLPAWKAVQ